jgi:hypothetical protein
MSTRPNTGNTSHDRKRKDERSYHDVDKKHKPSEKTPSLPPIDLSSSKFDILSPDFDPHLALYNLTDLPKGLPKVKPMDSIQRCRFLLPPGCFP